ncbi:MAG: hypothetical protein IKY82_02810 [Alistipes sp.]|nr:hypothetical protein [Alistipes sp.]
MKFIVRLSLCIALGIGAMTASAQQYKLGGLMMDHDGMMSSDMFSLSQVNFGFGTARSMAMAGAFTSLGADAAAIGVNPAGLGMYRHNEVSISPIMGFSNTKNSAKDWGSNEQSRFALSNFGAVFNISESVSKRGVFSATMAVGFNRVADFNYRTSYSSQSAPSTAPYRSINDAFIRQLGQGGLFPVAETGVLNYNYADAYFWGGALAYNNYLIDSYTDEEGSYWTSADRLGANAGIGHSVEEQSRGSINEFDIALGLNFGNKLYVGATLGIQSVRQKRQLYYGEDYLYNGEIPTYSDGTPLAAPAEWMDYNQAVNIKGVGTNLKVGAIYRPIPSVRLGLAIHTPTSYVLMRTYQAYMASNFNPVGDTTVPLDDIGENSWEFTSPARLMAGASYTLGQWAIFSVDYERTWYNGMRVQNIPAGFDISRDSYRNEFTNNYKGANTLRAGVEFKPIPMLSLRAGYGLAGSALRNANEYYYNAPTNYKTECLSAGLGLSFGRISVDLAYQNVTNYRTEYLLYYAYDAIGGYFDTASPIYKSDLKRNYFILTTSVKF